MLPIRIIHLFNVYNMYNLFSVFCKEFFIFKDHFYDDKFRSKQMRQYTQYLIREVGNIRMNI